MTHPLLDVSEMAAPPSEYLRDVGEVFARFDERTQDSGNVSFGVRIGEERFFVKTAGDPADTRPFVAHPDRVALLRNAVVLWESSRHPALARLHHVLETPHGPALVYEWLDGELLHATREARALPASAYQRFRALSSGRIVSALQPVFEVHAQVAEAGWVAVDFYDGCLMYHFESAAMRLVDLDMYHRGPFVNEMGRMFGSTRYMAPEEFQRGATIDQRTTLFTLGRLLAVFLSDGTLDRAPFRGTDAQHAVMLRACREDPNERFQTVGEFYRAWTAATGLKVQGCKLKVDPELKVPG